MKLEDIYKAAMDKWGKDLQLQMLQEECAELIVAISHFLRGRHNGNVYENITEEIVDVKIMIGQISMLLNRDKLDELMAMKLTRLQDRIK